MNIKKFLKKEAQENLRETETDEDRAFLARMLDSVEEKPQKKNRSKQWLWAVPTGVSACIVAALLTVELVSAPGNNLDEIKYEEANFVQVKLDFLEFFETLDGLTINVSEENVSGIQKTYDSVSGDDLFYTVNIEEISDSAYYSFEAQIVVNDKFEFENFEIGDAVMTETYPDYTVNYSQSVTFSSDMGLNLVRCKAKIEGACDIYITNYREYSFENGTFLTVIGNLFEFRA